MVQPVEDLGGGHQQRKIWCKLAPQDGKKSHQENMERQPPMCPPDKKKARKEETKAEEGDEMSNNGQHTPSPRPEGSVTESKPQALLPEERIEEHDRGKATEPAASEEKSTKTGTGGPSEEDLLLLRRCQKEYRDMMRTRKEVTSRKIMLRADIRYGPINDTPDNEIQEMEAECVELTRRRKEVEEMKPQLQRRLEYIRGKITGLESVSSMTDPIAWGTHTPVPTVNEDEDEESEEGTSD